MCGGMQQVTRRPVSCNVAPRYIVTKAEILCNVEKRYIVTQTLAKAENPSQ